ncbi:MAG: MFS transporter [Spirochaetia bacterium]|nr:MFS transporter [Spirochaetia bacterium]
MPWIAFLANGLWLMVIGLLGPSIPSIIVELNLSYSSAGLIFTLLSAGSLLGSLIAGVVSDFSKRKLLWMSLVIILMAGLMLIGFTPGYIALLITIFFMSLFGGPIGAVGQSIMLQMYPEKRGKYLSLSTMFAAGGSFTAPLITALVLFCGGTWRAAFFTVAGFVLILFIWMLFIKLPDTTVQHGAKIPFKTIVSDKAIIFVGLLIFLSVGVDIGFSYWLAEYFTTVVGFTAVYSSIAVSAYLCGVMIGRFSLSRYAHSAGSGIVIITGLAVSTVLLAVILNVQNPWLKLILCPFYGIGIGPLFPYLLAQGTGLYPGKPGAVTGVLFAMMSLSGMVFPFVIGVIGTNQGIAGAYYTLIGIEILIFFGIILRVCRTNQAQSKL